MAKAERRQTAARKAFQAFALHADRATEDDVARDVATLRFMLAFEAGWKAAQSLLRDRGVEAPSPNAALRASRLEGWLDDAEARTAQQMVADRNIAVHTDNEDLAIQLAQRLPDGHRLLASWLDALETAARERWRPTRPARHTGGAGGV